MTCLFLSCYHKGRFPICNFGPSRCACCSFFFFAVFIFAYLVFMIETFREGKPTFGLVCYVSICLNWILFCATMFKDPGVEQCVYDHHIKMLQGVNGKSTDQLVVETEVEEVDLENVSGGSSNGALSGHAPKLRSNPKTKKQQFDAWLENKKREATQHDKYLEMMNNKKYRPKVRKTEKGSVKTYFRFCEKCNYDVDSNKAQHCKDCQVCISGMDHHCIFYSKCIGNGNIC